MLAQRETMRRIREALRNQTLVQPFRASDVNCAAKITYAGVFLPKHRVGNPGMNGKKNTEHFVQIERGLYRLK